MFIKEAERLSERQSQLQCTSFHCMLPFAATRCSAHYADHQARSNNLTRQSPVQCLIQTTLMRDCPSLNNILFGELFPSHFHVNNTLTKSHPSFKKAFFLFFFFLFFFLRVLTEDGFHITFSTEYGIPRYDLNCDINQQVT